MVVVSSGLSPAKKSMNPYHEHQMKPICADYHSLLSPSQPSAFSCFGSVTPMLFHALDAQRISYAVLHPHDIVVTPGILSLVDNPVTMLRLQDVLLHGCVLLQTGMLVMT